MLAQAAVQPSESPTCTTAVRMQRRRWRTPPFTSNTPRRLGHSSRSRGGSGMQSHVSTRCTWQMVGRRPIFENRRYYSGAWWGSAGVRMLITFFDKCIAQMAGVANSGDEHSDYSDAFVQIPTSQHQSTWPVFPEPFRERV